MAENTTLVTRQQEHQTATTLYGDSESLSELCTAVKAVAPWANDKQTPMSDHEIGLAVRRAVAMGLDPLNTHEVQIWKDKRGNVNFQLSYTLMMEWVRWKFGDFTDPQYHRLGAEEMVEEGLAPQDAAYRVSFLMKSDIGNLMDLMTAGYKPEAARQMLEISGLGTASASEWNNAYFAPAGRSKAWKVQKRAVVDAIRRKFGTPTRSDIEELRRIGAVLSDVEIERRDESPAANAMPADYGRGRSKLFKTEAPPPTELESDPVIDGDFTEIVDEPETLPADADEDDAPGLRYAPEALRDAIQKRIEERRNDAFSYGPRRRGFVTAVISNLESCTDGDGTDFRHVVSWYLTGKDSSKKWDDAEVKTLHRWLNAAQDENEVWHVDPSACREAHAVYAEAQRDLGQAELFEDPERPITEE